MEQWFHEMETTDKGQTNGWLSYNMNVDGDYTSDQRYCCLGLGSLLVPGIEITDLGDGEDHRQNFGVNKEDLLAPVEFIDWLGIDHRELDATRIPGEDPTAYDIVFDFPEGMHSPELKNSPSGSTYVIYREGLTAAGLNDAGFTFKQIADIGRYFGIAGVK